MLYLKLTDSYNSSRTPDILTDKEYPIHCEPYGDKDIYMLVSSDCPDNSDIVELVTTMKATKGGVVDDITAEIVTTISGTTPPEVKSIDTFSKMMEVTSMTIEDGELRFVYQGEHITIELCNHNPFTILNGFFVSITMLNRLRENGY